MTDVAAAPTVAPRRSPTTALRRYAEAILDALVHHRLLTVAQVHELVMPERKVRWVQTELVELERRGLAARVMHGPRHERRWFATPDGVVAVHGTAAGHYTMDHRKAVGPAAAHTLAVNDTGLALLRWARRREHEPVLSWQHEVAIDTGMKGRKARLVADAAVTWLADTDDGLVHVHRLVEVERCNQATDRVAEKVWAYLAAMEHGAWQGRWPVFPTVAIVFCDGGQARPVTRMSAVFDLLDGVDLGGLRVQLTTFDQLERRGPFEPVALQPGVDHLVPLIAL